MEEFINIKKYIIQENLSEKDEIGDYSISYDYTADTDDKNN